MRRLRVVCVAVALLIPGTLAAYDPVPRSVSHATVRIPQNYPTIQAGIKAAQDTDLDGSTDVLRFAVIGDYGNNSTAEQRVAALVQGWKPDFVITTGDNNYPLGEARTIDVNIGKYYSGLFPPSILFFRQPWLKYQHALALSGVGADVVMSGHDHGYERIDAKGFPYFVNGSGGASL
jgi:hypothetical protein